jgi:hypothetical protein
LLVVVGVMGCTMGPSSLRLSLTGGAFQSFKSQRAVHQVCWSRHGRRQVHRTSAQADSKQKQASTSSIPKYR